MVFEEAKAKHQSTGLLWRKVRFEEGWQFLGTTTLRENTCGDVSGLLLVSVVPFFEASFFFNLYDLYLNTN